MKAIRQFFGTKRFQGCCTAWLLILLLTTTNSHARPLDELVASGHITIFVYEDYAPYSWQEGETLKGIDVDIARVIAEKLGVELKFLVRGADENVDDDLRVNIWKGDLIHRKVADVMMHVPYDRELDIRNELAVLSTPYFREELAVLADEEKLPVVENFARFMHDPIGVEVDTVGDFFLSNSFGGKLQTHIRRGRTFGEVASMFLKRKVPAVMGSKAQMEWISSQTGSLEAHISQPPMPGIVRRSWPVGFAVKHDSRDLAYAVGDIVAEMANSGQLSEICERYGVTWNRPEAL